MVLPAQGPPVSRIRVTLTLSSPTSDTVLLLFCDYEWLFYRERITLEESWSISIQKVVLNLYNLRAGGCHLLPWLLPFLSLISKLTDLPLPFKGLSSEPCWFGWDWLFINFVNCSMRRALILSDAPDDCYDCCYWAGLWFEAARLLSWSCASWRDSCVSCRDFLSLSNIRSLCYCNCFCIR